MNYNNDLIMDLEIELDNEMIFGCDDMEGVILQMTYILESDEIPSCKMDRLSKRSMRERLVDGE